MKNSKKNILVCVAGATPQVITETIYALAAKSPPVYIEELYVITTAYGRRLIKEKLLDEGILAQLVREYKLPPIRFTEESIIVIKDSAGNTLDDIRNDKDNESTGDIITDFIRKMSKREDIALHCSIAGGRKTMSFYLGSALQLFGRPQDRLYHVLVSPEFENNPDFFYPPRRPVRIRCRMPDGTERLLSTRNAEIHLADLPFVRLKDKVWLEKKTFREFIREAEVSMRLAISHLPLRLKLRERLLFIGDIKIPLPPMLLSLYALFAEEKLFNCRNPERADCIYCNDCYLTMAELKGRGILKRIQHINVSIYGTLSSRFIDSRWTDYFDKGGLPEETIRQYISKVNGKIKNYLNDYELYLINSTGRYASKRYGIRADKSRISFVQ